MNPIRNRGLLTGFAMVLATLLVTAAIGYVNVRRLYEYNQLVEHAHQVVSELRNLLGLVADAESGIRGYVIASEEDYLKSYDIAKVTVPDTVARIHGLTSGNPRQAALAKDLEAQVARRMQHLSLVVGAANRAGPAAGQAEVATGAGQQAMEDVRKAIRLMEREEDAILAQRVGDATLVYWTAVASSFLSAVLGLALAIAGLWLTSRDLKAREARTAELKRLNEQLEERVRERTADISQTNAALLEEIAERKRAERAVRSTAEELERSNRELTQFASVASHDLQEPLRKIQAFGDRLLGQCGDQLNEKGKDYLDRILAATGRMRQLIDGLLEYSRVSTRNQPRVPVDLGQVARDVVSDLEARLHATGGEVQLGNLPTIDADALQMRQLLQNLIGNALKFRRLDTLPRVQVSAQILPAPLSANGDSQLGLVCELSVQDNGVGFEPAYAERIFELFQRLHGRGEYEGTGMGLAICKKIAERHGGSIAATSEPGEGAKFTVKLPVSQSQGSEP
jgi:signal transduction histidine kinase